MLDDTVAPPQLVIFTIISLTTACRHKSDAEVFGIQGYQCLLRAVPDEEPALHRHTISSPFFQICLMQAYGWELDTCLLTWLPLFGWRSPDEYALAYSVRPKSYLFHIVFLFSPPSRLEIICLYPLSQFQCFTTKGMRCTTWKNYVSKFSR